MQAVKPKSKSSVKKSKLSKVTQQRIEDDQCRLLVSVADALSYVVNTQTEIVVHDLRQPESSIVKIVNGHVSGRHEGQSVLSVPEEDLAFAKMLEQEVRHSPNSIEVTGNYHSKTKGGKTLKSSSVLVYDSNGSPLTALCLNYDIASAIDLCTTIQSYLTPYAKPESSRNVEDSDMTMEELIKDIIDKALASASGVSVDRMNKKEKIEVVAQMHARGLFLIRGSVERAAASLGITKFTIYNYMDELGISRS